MAGRLNIPVVELFNRDIAVGDLVISPENKGNLSVMVITAAQYNAEMGNDRFRHYYINASYPHREWGLLDNKYQYTGWKMMAKRKCYDMRYVLKLEHQLYFDSSTVDDDEKQCVGEFIASLKNGS